MIGTLSIAVQNALPMQTMNLWNDFVTLLYNILDWIYGLVGNFGVAVILFTILVRLVLLPLDIKSKGSMKKMAGISPEVQKINEKYKNDPEKKNRKLQELYVQNKVNPLGGCLPMLLQLPLFFAFFAALRSISYQEMTDFYVQLINQFAGQDVIAINASGDIMKFFSKFGPAMQNLFKNVDKFKGAFEALIAEYPNNFDSSVMNLDVLYSTVRTITVPQALSFLQGNEHFHAYQFLWIKNIWVPDSPLVDVIGRPVPYANMFSNISAGFNNGFFLLAAITGASSYFQMKISQQQNAAAQQNKGMQMLMPLMGVFFVAIYTASFGVYWVTSNVVMIVQQVVYNKVTIGNYLGKPAGEGGR